jgi:hypothetical protein
LLSLSLVCVAKRDQDITLMIRVQECCSKSISRGRSTLIYIEPLRDGTLTASVPDDAVPDTGDQDDEEADPHGDPPESEDEPEAEDGELVNFHHQ